MNNGVFTFFIITATQFFEFVGYVMNLFNVIVDTTLNFVGKELNIIMMAQKLLYVFQMV